MEIDKTVKSTGLLSYKTPISEATLLTNKINAVPNYAYPQPVQVSQRTNLEPKETRLIYSPYLSPSHDIISKKSEASLNHPVYMHNIARSKYYAISRPAQPKEHQVINLLA